MSHGDPLSPPGDPPDGGLARLRTAWSGLGLSAAESGALALLSAGAVAALVLLWWLARSSAGVPAGDALGLPPPGAVPSPGALADDGPAPTPVPTAVPSPAPGAAPSTAPPGEVVVHVAGLVARPGVYRLPAGGRVADAVAVAGGALPEATPEGLNLARAVVDGEQVLVPGPGVPTVAPPPAPGAPSGSAGGHGAPAPGGAVRPDGTLDLNLATADDLDELPGVGEVLAQRILDHRAQIGRFSDVGELRDVSGIGEKTFQELAPLVVV